MSAMRVDATEPTELICALIEDTAEQLSIVSRVQQVNMSKKDGDLSFNGSGKHSSVTASAWTADVVKNGLRGLSDQFMQSLEKTEGRLDFITDMIREMKERQNAGTTAALKLEQLERDTLETQRELQTDKEQQNEKENNQIIAQLEATLNHTLVPHTNAHIQYERRHMKAVEQARQRRHAYLEQDVHRREQLIVENHTELENTAHKAIMEFTNEQLADARKSLESWIEKFERDEIEMQQRIDQVKDEGANAGSKYEQLKSEYDELAKIVQEDHLAKEKIRSQEELRVRQERSAIKMQRWWRKKLPAIKSKRASGKKTMKGAAKKK